jgi:hypothetical protein
MSIGSFSPIAAVAAGTSLAQTKGTESDRAAHETSAHQRQVQNELKAEAAAGIGETDGEDNRPSERDADGRLPWQLPDQQRSSSSPTPPAGHAKDPTGESGGLLDLCG